MDIKDRINEVICETIGCSEEHQTFTAEDHLTTNLGLRTGEIYTLLVTLERSLKLPLTAEQMAECETVGDVYKMFEGLATTT